MNLKPIKAIIVAGTVVIVATSALKNNLEAQAVKKAYELPDSFTVTAHSGCNGTKDNTIESLKAAIDSGADILELDVREDENGIAIMTHDYESGVEYPTFEEALRFIKENSDTIKVNVDLKVSSVSFAADEVIRSTDMADRCFFTGVNEEDVPTVSATATVPYFVNIRPTFFETISDEYWENICKKINKLGGIGVNCNFRLITKRAIEICKRNSLLVSVFTPSSDVDLGYALMLSPDNITTRNPGYILSKRGINK